MNKVAFYTLGCKVNQYETEAMEEMFEKEGYEIVNSDSYADVYVINTCTVTNLSDRKSRQFIRRTKRINGDSIVAVVGCYSQVAPEEIAEINGVDVIIGTTERHRIVELCEKAKKSNELLNIVQNINGMKNFEDLNINEVKSKTRAFIKIQDGCNQFCSYCIIPYARGPIRSRSLENIVKECQRLAYSGFKEVVLTGIHVASYGKDLKEQSITLLDVIEEINELKGIERIRLSSIEPTLIDDKFMKRYAKLSKVCPHFHLSLQSGSDTVLENMNRKYTTAEYKETVSLIRKYLPHAGITTDIIVGFPGETEKEFNETLNFVKDIGFSRIHVFKYSPRRGTPASRYRNQVHGNVKQSRSERLIELAEEEMAKFHLKFVGETMEVLFEEEIKNHGEYMVGYTDNYIRVVAKTNLDIRGKILPVKVQRGEEDYLIGEIKDF